MLENCLMVYDYPFRLGFSLVYVATRESHLQNMNNSTHLTQESVPRHHLKFSNSPDQLDFIFPGKHFSLELNNGI